MRMCTLTYLTLFCMLLAGCARSAEKRTAAPELPEDWQRIEIAGISFFIPAGLEETAAKASTGALRQFAGLQLQVNVHAGDYASTLREFESASGSFEWLQIEGRRARGASVILDGRAYDGVYFPEPGDAMEPLSILVISLSPEARQQGMLVLQSIRFK